MQIQNLRCIIYFVHARIDQKYKKLKKKKKHVNKQSFLINQVLQEKQTLIACLYIYARGRSKSEENCKLPIYEQKKFYNIESYKRCFSLLLV